MCIRDRFDPQNWTYPKNDIHKYFELKTKLNNIVREKARMICFSIDEPQFRISVYGHRSSGMWAHYGDKHRGVCVLLDRDTFIHENKKIIDIKGRVKYTNELKKPEINLSTIQEIDDSTVDNLIKELRNSIFFTKLKDWRYENEYRIVNYRHPETEFASIKDSIVGIVLGMRVNDNYLPTILRLTHKSTKVYKAVFHNKYILKDCINGHIRY